MANVTAYMHGLSHTFSETFVVNMFPMKPRYKLLNAVGYCFSGTSRHSRTISHLSRSSAKILSSRVVCIHLELRKGLCRSPFRIRLVPDFVDFYHNSDGLSFYWASGIHTGSISAAVVRPSQLSAFNFGFYCFNAA